MFSLVSSKFLAMCNIVLYSVPNPLLSICFILSKTIMSLMITILHFRYSRGSSALCAGWESNSCSPFNLGNQTIFYIGVKADSTDSDVRDATLKFTRGNIANVTDGDDIQGNLLRDIDNCLGAF